MGFNAVCCNDRFKAEAKASGSSFLRRLYNRLGEVYGIANLSRYEYSKVMDNFFSNDNYKIDCFSTITPGYDTTPRRGKKAIIYKNPTPEAFQKHIHKTLKYIEDKDFDHRIITLDSWNEWAEGNYMEPDQKYGMAYINALRHEIIIE